MTSRHRRRPAAALGLALAALLLTACGGAGSGSADQAADDAVVVYSGRSEGLVGPLLARFTDSTGVAVSVRYGDTAELAAQLLEEGDRSPAEVYLSQDAGALERLHQAGLLAPLPARTLDLVPATYRGDDGTWVGTSGRARVLFYNDDTVAAADLPDSVLDLTDPRWKGQVGIAAANASFQSFVTAMRITLGEQAAEEWLTAMVANDVQRYDNNSAIRDAVDTGQISLGLANHYYWFEKATEVGAESLAVQNHFLAAGDVGSLVNVAGAAVLATGAEDADALRLVDFLLSSQAQEYFATTTFEYPLVAGVDPADGLPALADVEGPDISLGQLADLDGTQALLTRVGLL